MLTPDELKTKQREIRARFSASLGLRVHRAISWLQRASVEKDDHDVAFILLWIAFNACYAEDRGRRREWDPEKSLFNDYFGRILQLDTTGEVQTAIWQRFSGPIRIFLDNQYLYQPFWDFHNGIPENDDWEQRFAQSRKAACRALAHCDTQRVLSILFDRLYVLRNQLVHGGATWNSEVNRSQLRDGIEILFFLLPHFINIMMDHDNAPWGDPHYPVIDG